MKCWTAPKCEFDMFLQKVFTAHGKPTRCVQQWAVDHTFVLLGLCCNGSDSSCQVSLFSRVHEPCSVRRRKSCIMKRNTVLYFSLCYSSWLHIYHIRPSCYRELLDLLKKMSLSVGHNWFFFYFMSCSCWKGCQVCVQERRQRWLGV